MRDSSFAPRSGGILVRSPSSRQLAARRWAVVAGGVLALAAASAAAGAIGRPAAEVLGRPHTGPFSYFPSE